MSEMEAHLIQGTDSWKIMRRGYVMASDSPIIMGESPFSTQYKLWQDKLDLLPPQEENPAMRRGTELEPIARAAFEKEIGLEFFPKVIFHPDVKFMGASMDGITLDGSAAVEIKCPGKIDHSLALNGVIPDHYMPQLQHQLACSGLDMIWYYSFDGLKGVPIPVKRDDEYIKKMIEEEAKFWECVETFTPPPMTNKDYQKKDSSLWDLYGSRLSEIDILMGELKKEKDSIKKELVADANGQSSRGGGLTLSRSFPLGKVNYGLVTELEGVNLDKYRPESKEVWTLRVSKKA